MARTMILLFFVYTSMITLGQQKEELIRVVCDSTNFSFTNFPPTLNLTSEQLESIINQEFSNGNQDNDTILNIYICAVINCQGNAEYKLMNKIQTNAVIVSGEKILNILKGNCQWSAGKLKKDYYEKIRVRKGNKYVYEKRMVTEKVHYTFCMKFELNSGKVYIRSKINTSNT